MKTKSKALLLTLCAVLLVAASILGTMAYLTSTATVTNTFTVGNVELGGDGKYGLDEAKTNENGEPLKKGDNGYGVTEEVSEAERVKENKYKLQPGHTYTKDPTIHVGEDSDNCYLFVKVENGIAGIEDSTDNIAEQMADNGWKALGEDYDNIYVYVGDGDGEGESDPLAVSANTNVLVFEQFKVADTVGSDTLKDYENKNITVVAYAVQVDGFADKTDAQIWEAAFAKTVTADPDESE